jgi:CheY-like chemotaxis protein
MVLTTRKSEKIQNGRTSLYAYSKGNDREEILNAGASDYQSKPIDIQQLISLISIWIYK